jgi:hypothetical protein
MGGGTGGPDWAVSTSMLNDASPFCPPYPPRGVVPSVWKVRTLRVDWFLAAFSESPSLNRAPFILSEAVVPVSVPVPGPDPASVAATGVDSPPSASSVLLEPRRFWRSFRNLAINGYRQIKRSANATITPMGTPIFAGCESPRGSRAVIPTCRALKSDGRKCSGNAADAFSSRPEWTGEMDDGGISSSCGAIDDENGR